MLIKEKKEIIFLRNLVQSCENCELCKLDINNQDNKDKSKGKVFSTGYSNAKLFFIGESPFYKREVGSDGIIRPFNYGNESENSIGSGKMLFDALWKLKVRREDVYITNLIKCSYDDERKKRIKNHFECCYPMTLIEIDVVIPKVIFLLGNLVRDFFIDRVKIGEKTKLGTWVFAIPHPAWVYRNRWNEEVVNVYRETIYYNLKESGYL
jgi:uracil-DNA glycosylase family 4